MMTRKFRSGSSQVSSTSRRGDAVSGPAASTVAASAAATSPSGDMESRLRVQATRGCGTASLRPARHESGSTASGPAITSSASRMSATSRAIGPEWPSSDQPPKPGPCGTSPKVGLNPATPQSAAGNLIEPPPSVPMLSAPQPEATAAALPPDEPPGVKSRFHGLRVTPQSGLSVTVLWQNSGVVVLPMTMAPAAFSRSTTTASRSGTKPAKRREPPAVGTDLV
jgi:hypothetical protein